MKESAIPKILTFWLEEITLQHWFKKDDAFDNELRERFGDYVADALGARLDQWAQTEDGCLALILLLTSSHVISIVARRCHLPVMIWRLPCL